MQTKHIINIHFKTQKMFCVNFESLIYRFKAHKFTVPNDTRNMILSFIGVYCLKILYFKTILFIIL